MPQIKITFLWKFSSQNSEFFFCQNSNLRILRIQKLSIVRNFYIRILRGKKRILFVAATCEVFEKKKEKLKIVLRPHVKKAFEFCLSFQVRLFFSEQKQQEQLNFLWFLGKNLKCQEVFLHFGTDPLPYSTDRWENLTEHKDLKQAPPRAAFSHTNIPSCPDVNDDLLLGFLKWFLCGASAPWWSHSEETSEGTQRRKKPNLFTRHHLLNFVELVTWPPIRTSPRCIVDVNSLRTSLFFR